MASILLFCISVLCMWWLSVTTADTVNGNGKEIDTFFNQCVNDFQAGLALPPQLSIAVNNTTYSNGVGVIVCSCIDTANAIEVPLSEGTPQLVYSPSNAIAAEAVVPNGLNIYCEFFITPEATITSETPTSSETSSPILLEAETTKDVSVTVRQDERCMRHETFSRAEAKFRWGVKELFIKLDWLLFSCLQVALSCLLVVDSLIHLLWLSMKLVFAGFCIVHSNLNICNMGFLEG